MCTNKLDISYKPEVCKLHIPTCHRCICVNIHLAPLMYRITIVRVYIHIYIIGHYFKPSYSGKVIISEDTTAQWSCLSLLWMFLSQQLLQTVLLCLVDSTSPTSPPIPTHPPLDCYTDLVVMITLQIVSKDLKSSQQNLASSLVRTRPIHNI